MGMQKGDNMSVGALSTNFFGGSFYSTASKGKKTDTAASFEVAVKKREGDERNNTKASSAANRGGGAVPYTRCITANIKTQEMLASQSEDGEMIYSYQASEQKFQIMIKSDGTDKSYTIKGTLENGEEFEREFDPYNVAPEYADFPEFSALCLYIQQTDETANLLANDYFTNGDIFEKKDYLSMLEQFPSSAEFSSQESLIRCALDLVDALHGFLSQRMGLTDAASSENIDALFTDRDSESSSSIKESVITRHTEFTDPDTGASVPVDIRYTVGYSENGISCKEVTDVGGKSSERELWTVEYEKPGDETKVRKFLEGFSEDDRLTFATQEHFWRDFLEDDFDIDGFRAFYDSTDNGRIDIEAALDEGKSLRETLTEPNADYFNNNSFVGHVWTEQEMWDNWNARIEASQRSARANGSDIEPPTETMITSNNKARNYRDQAFQYVGRNAPDRVKQAWLDAADEIGIDGQGITGAGTLDHIPQFMIQRFIREYNGYDPDDLLGRTVGSAMKAARDAIYSLDHPLEPDSTRSADVRRAREREREFYVRFLEKLNGRMDYDYF